MRRLLDKPWKKLLVFLVIFSFVGLAAQEPPKQGAAQSGDAQASGTAATNPCAETQSEIAEAQSEAAEAEAEVADYKAELAEEQKEGNCGT